MPVSAGLRSAAKSDAGRRRKNNEDRYLVNAARGIFAVIDGVGGHAAGERAAETAREVIRERLERPTGSPEERLREAIALANNEIYRLAHSRTEWNGMACVLTIALIEEDVVTVGHVGDSRLYLLRAGEIRKITHDHSPVGEREDRGELTEAEAMRHSRRNEIYRDVGSDERSPDDPGFIEIISFPMPADAALLLCSDGLSDLVSGAEIRAGVERYSPDLDRAAQALIDAANHAGGKDNVTVVLVAAADYKPVAAPFEPGVERRGNSRAWWGALAIGCALGVAAGVAGPIVMRHFSQAPRSITVGAEGIGAVLARAHSGDTVLIPPGKYKERVVLVNGVTVHAQETGGSILLSPDGGAAVVAKNIQSGSLEGVWVQGDMQNPLATGIQVVDSSPSIVNVKVTGAAIGIEILGKSEPRITSSQIANNLGAGIAIGAGAKPLIEGNLIAANGAGKPGLAQPGVEVQDGARPILKNNGIVNNAAEPIWIFGRDYLAGDYTENFFGGLPAKSAIHLVLENEAPRRLP